MPHNELLHPRCNIGTDDHLFFTKFLISKLQDFLGKLLSPHGFLQFHMIVVLICNEWFLALHVLVLERQKLVFFSFSEFIFLYTSPIIWLLRSCHLYRDFFIWYNDLIPPLHVALCWDIGGTTCYQELPLVTCRMDSSWSFPEPELSRCFDWWERGCFLLPATDVIYMLPFIFLP